MLRDESAAPHRQPGRRRPQEAPRDPEPEEEKKTRPKARPKERSLPRNRAKKGRRRPRAGSCRNAEGRRRRAKPRSKSPNPESTSARREAVERCRGLSKSWRERAREARKNMEGWCFAHQRSLRARRAGSLLIGAGIAGFVWLGGLAVRLRAHGRGVRDSRSGHSRATLSSRTWTSVARPRSR